MEKADDLKSTSQEEDSIPGGAEHILLVDDEEVIVRMERQMLKRLGYRVTTRTGSIEALEAFKANPDRFDLVITDQSMPNLNGIQLLGRIRQIRPNQPLIICTGFSDQITEEKCKALRIQGFVLKPVIMKDMARIIRHVLDQ